MNKQLVSNSKFLRLVLRHQPETTGMQLDDLGWMDFNALNDKANARGNPITLEMLHEVVATNEKQRFALSEEGLRIRASQGHSVASVDLQLTPAKPPMSFTTERSPSSFRQFAKRDSTSDLTLHLKPTS